MPKFMGSTLSKPAVRVSATATVHVHTTEALFFFKDALKAAMDEAIGFDTVASAKEMCPVLTKATAERYPGEMRDSIDSRVTIAKSGVRARVFTTCGYGGYVERGTKKTPRQPSIYPAFEQNVGKVPTLLKEALMNFVPSEKG